MSLFSPPMLLESSALHSARANKLKPGGEASYYARLLATEEVTQTPAWKAIIKAVAELGAQHFGGDYTNLVKNGQFRSPIRQDVAGKSWPDNVVAFLNLKSGACQATG